MAEDPISEPEDGMAHQPEPDDFLVVGIGASAGGIQALKEFFEQVPAGSGMAYVVILHLSPDHDSHLAQVLQSVVRIPVLQVTQRVKVQPDHVYVVPPNEHLTMIDGDLAVTPNISFEERRAPVDIFFRTLAETHAGRAVAVILSGTGANGSMGLKRVKERGGAAFVQNPREAEFSEMPRNAIATDLVDMVLNAAEIPAKLIAYKEGRGSIEIPPAPENRDEEQQRALREIFTHLRVRTGHDFSNYKRATVLRRIERRMNVRELADLPSYAAFLRDQAEEVTALLKDLLISVTNFFRDKDNFAYLESDILPRILQGKDAENQLRVWVAGCATGEEAYSLAMLLAEQTARDIDAPSFQIFATDIDQGAIATAREGFYTLNDAADVSPERLRRFFTPENGGYRVRRELRERILFANHNVIKDPPFSHLDLVTCRNLLIYLKTTAQKRVMEVFHFALNPGGYLFLGSAESVDGVGDLYAAVSKEHRLYQSRQVTARIVYPVPEATSSFRLAELLRPLARPGQQEAQAQALERISYGALHLRLLEEYAPPSILVNENFDIVHISERAGRYLQFSGGELSQNLLPLVRQELRLELRAALYQAVQQKIRVEAKNLKVQIEGQTEAVNIYIRPVLNEADTARGFVIILFEQANVTNEAPESAYITPEPAARRLEEELTRSQSQLRQAVEQHELQAEELKSSNEELQSMNEELRSSAEELETSKEELQSMNEELRTVNQKLKVKLEEAGQTSNDLQNLINSTNIGTIFLDRSMRVALFTPSTREIFNLIPADYGRPLSDITHRLVEAEISPLAEAVLETLQTVEREVGTTDGRTFLMRIAPYRTVDDRINGVVVTFVDLTERRRAEEQVRQSEEKYRTLFNSIDEGFCIIEVLFDKNGEPFDYRFIETNPAFVKQTGIENGVGRTVREFAADHETFWFEIYGEIARTGEPKRFEHQAEALNPPRFYDVYAFRVGAAGENRVAVLFNDITERKKSELELTKTNRLLQATFDNSLLIIQLFKAVRDERDGEIVDFEWVMTNERWNELYGAMAGKRLLAENPAVIETGLFDDFKRVTETGVPLTQEHYYRHEQFDGWFLQSVAKVEDGFLLSTLDITERRKAEEAVRESEARLRLATEASEMATWEWHLMTDEIFWNERHFELFGMKPGKNPVKPDLFFRYVHPEDRKQVEEQLKRSIEKRVVFDADFRVVVDGVRWMSGYGGVVEQSSDGKPTKMSGVMFDITERKRAEEALQRAHEVLENKVYERTRELHEANIELQDEIAARTRLEEERQRLLHKIVQTQEEERRRLSRELHDHLGQQLVALRLNVEMLREQLQGNSAEALGGVMEIIKRLDAEVDFLAWELRPASLDELGLAETVATFVREWSRQFGVAAEFHSSGLDGVRLAKETESNLYRIAQEALNNTAKHAKASRVSVILKGGAGAITLIVEDDGIGFDPERALPPNEKDQGLGLVGMRERAALIGGTVEIESSPGSGTTVFVRVPLPAA